MFLACYEANDEIPFPIHVSRLMDVKGLESASGPAADTEPDIPLSECGPIRTEPKG